MDTGNRWRTSDHEPHREERSNRSRLVLLAMGFLKPEQPKFAENVFLAGDAATGASLVVRGDGRRTKGCCGHRSLFGEVTLTARNTMKFIDYYLFV